MANLIQSEVKWNKNHGKNLQPFQRLIFYLPWYLVVSCLIAYRALHITPTGENSLDEHDWIYEP
jgi:hypothetical protein